MSADNSLRTVLDVQEVTTLLYRSLRCADDKLFDQLLDCYNDEVTIDFGGVKPPQQLSKKDLAAWAQRAYALVKTQHMMFNVEVDINGDRATSRSCGHALHERTDTKDFWHIHPRYENGYTRTEKGWRISRIRMTPIFEEGNPALLEESWAAAGDAT
ncbi:nuclear transport factor 2 family protein [Burkholderia gladioli]|uniref:nuclear transport factor 2 family protein n=1 Tax=Burkholderia gladioli TaxID=28095 RepID=UPI00163FEAA7|nr:nuclear transport factor 2 family protein [Burkholderia gladioli]